MERINHGAEVAPIDPAIIESWWDAMSSVPPERRGHSAVGLGAIAGNRPMPSLGPDERVALLMRCTLLNSLSERHLLDDYLADPALRKKMFAAISSISLTRNDLIEAMADRIFREAPATDADRCRAEMISEGLDPESPKIVGRLIALVGEHS